jgi:hypothetical protein
VYRGTAEKLNLRRDGLVVNVISPLTSFLPMTPGVLATGHSCLLFIVALDRVDVGGCCAEVGEMSDPTVPLIRAFS